MKTLNNNFRGQIDLDNISDSDLIGAEDLVVVKKRLPSDLRKQLELYLSVYLQRLLITNLISKFSEEGIESVSTISKIELIMTKNKEIYLKYLTILMFQIVNFLNRKRLLLPVE